MLLLRDNLWNNVQAKAPFVLLTLKRQNQSKQLCLAQYQNSDHQDCFYLEVIQMSLYNLLKLHLMKEILWKMGSHFIVDDSHMNAAFSGKLLDLFKKSSMPQIYLFSLLYSNSGICSIHISRQSLLGLLYCQVVFFHSERLWHMLVYCVCPS